MPFFNETQRKNILHFKYVGGDTSLTYKYILSPFAQYLVDNFVPIWMAPNMVTLLGLLCSIISFILTLLFNPSLGPNGPRWVALLSGFAILAYQTLDNMDGKQARRTATSSPLGMLYDHGCDCINSCITTIPVASAVGVGWSMSLIVLYVLAFFPFIWQAWEEYFTGSMFLPLFNGPSEGLIMTASICIISGVLGGRWWHEPLLVLDPLPTPLVGLLSLSPLPLPFSLDSPPPLVLSRVGTMITFTALWTLLTVLIQSRKVAMTILSQKTSQSPSSPSSSYPHHHNAHSGPHTPHYSLPHAFSVLLPFFLLFISCFLLCLLSPPALNLYPMLTLLFLWSGFVDFIFHILVSHIAASDLRMGERYFCFLAPLLPLNHLLHSSSGPLFPELYLLLPLSLLSFLYTARSMYLVVVECAELLNIHVLVMGKRNQS